MAEDKTENEGFTLKDYTGKLDGGYMYTGSADKFKYIDRYNGWKIHLNVVPDNVEKVSEFLKKGSFTHKYLKGGEISAGKIFTVYFGPKSLTEEGVKEISDGIGDLLETPKASGEAPAAPKIVARFETDDIHYVGHAYFEGIPLLRGYDFENLAGSIEISRADLLKKFGDYFGGELTEYKS